MFEGIKKKFSKFVDSIASKEEEKIEEETLKDKKETASELPNEERVREEEIKKRERVHTEPKIREERKEQEKASEMPKREEHQKITEERELKKRGNVTFGTKLRSKIFKEIRISEKDINPFLEELRISLLESDVNYEVVEKVVESLRKELTEGSISSAELEIRISEKIRTSLMNILKSSGGIDIVDLAASKKSSGEMPFKILFLGPNGAGKTTTIAKIAKMFIDKGFSCMLSASDTFRAAAIEQTAIHASRLGIPVVKGSYGADPSSIAFDAVAHAKARHIDVVLIDSAGRQETNKSLMEEVKKMVRVTKPDLKIFIGESIAGNSLLNQLKEFDSAVGLDGIILTKLDCDAKGGNTLSILSETDVPVLFFGTGERYEDIMPYDPNFIIESIMPDN
ncbi:signal recognition particle-docking protein FtsY [Candidatus Marsarchaeota archaeon]|nr:signal recognition particle-docking protein FtsY [Candidatus Marsarchaeota archaeon]